MIYGLRNMGSVEVKYPGNYLSDPTVSLKKENEMYSEEIDH